MQTTQNTMTNDNNTRKKANAVFFAAIMVVSMVAVGFAAAPAAAIETIDDGDVDDLDKAAGEQSQSLTFTLENGTDYDGSASGTAEVAINVTTADSALTVTSATLDSLSGSNAGDVTSSGSNGVSVSGNVATLTIDESTLGTSDDTVTVGLTLDDVNASGASAGTVGYSVVSDGGPDFTDESVNPSFDITFDEGYDPANPY